MINNNWVFGTRAGLDFSNANATTLPVPTVGYPSDIAEGCATVSDANGRLLFYTNGINVWHNPASNTNNLPTNFVNLMAPPSAYAPLKGDPSSTQSSIIVPDPANNQRYYIFTTDGATRNIVVANDPNYHFEGHLLDLSTPLPALNPVNITNYPGNQGRSPVEKLTAVQKEDCSGYWVIVAVQESGNVDIATAPGLLRVFEVTASGVQFVQEYPLNLQIYDGGYMKVSPNGERLAISQGLNLPRVLLYEFDHATGTIDTSTLVVIEPDSNTIPTPPTRPINYFYGVEFSPDSNLLYISSLIDFSNTTQYLFQANLTTITSASITAPWVGSIPDFRLGALQLGPDNRIYIAKQGATNLAVIMDPNNVGTACNLQDNAINLGRGLSQFGLPNLLPNPCATDAPCNCSCNDCQGCNDNAEAQNAELIDRAQGKANTIPANENQGCDTPFQDDCNGNNAVAAGTDFAPCFYFHWGDSPRDQIEEHDTEVFYLTVCNRFEDLRYQGLRITSVTLVPDVEDLDRIHIVPDRFISLDCLEPCSCQTREFALLTRGTGTAGAYTLQVEYCYEGLALANSAGGGTATFPLEIVED